MMTIVVLLILATVSIQMLGGEDGIIKQAQESKKQTKISQEKEEIGLVVSNTKADKLQQNDNTYLKKSEIQQNLSNDLEGETTSISDI